MIFELAIATLLISSPPATIAAEGFQTPRQPQLCVTADEIIHLTFGDSGRVYYTRSGNISPLTFGKPVMVADVPNLSLGMPIALT